MPEKIEFTSENIDFYLKELSKVFRKLNGKTMPAEITLIGGASILINYGFRNFTYDMDAVIHASSAMKEAINQVSDKFQIPTDWLNTDFKSTKSYSPKLDTVSKHYKTFSNILEIRTISAEYLIAMKLMSGRKYKHDLSDVIGIINEHNNLKNPISLSQIKKAFVTLYDDINKMPSYSSEMLTSIFETKNLEELFKKVQNQESLFAEELTEFNRIYPETLNDDNTNEILDVLKAKKEKTVTKQLSISRKQIKDNSENLVKTHDKYLKKDKNISIE